MTGLPRLTLSDEKGVFVMSHIKDESTAARWVTFKLKKGETERVVCSQLEHSMPDASNDLNTIIAYEPVWAIGTGKVPTLEDIAHVHRRIRNVLKQEKGKDISQKMRILYGGSVKPENAKEIFSLDDVDGALVGGASLKADDFINIARQA